MLPKLIHLSVIPSESTRKVREASGAHAPRILGEGTAAPAALIREIRTDVYMAGKSEEVLERRDAEREAAHTGPVYQCGGRLYRHPREGRMLDVSVVELRWYVALGSRSRC